MMMKTIPLSLTLLFVCSAFSGDIIVERMQSVVDEVSDLRLRYERAVDKNKECFDQIQEQDKTIAKLSKNEGVDFKVFEQNRKRLEMLEAENKKLRENKDLQETQKELKALEKEKQRLSASAQILKEKNTSLIAQINEMKKMRESGSEDLVRRLEVKIATLETQVHSYERSASKEEKSAETQAFLKLEAQNRRLEKELKTAVSKECRPSKKEVQKKACSDDNPFPKLMMKEKEEMEPVIQIDKAASPNKLEEEPIIDFAPIDGNISRETLDKAGTYRMKYESPVYDAPQGEVVEIWEDQTSFTSNVSQGGWIKITGYFIDKKWQKSSSEMWVKEEQALKR